MDNDEVGMFLVLVLVLKKKDVFKEIFVEFILVKVGNVKLVVVGLLKGKWKVFVVGDDIKFISNKKVKVGDVDKVVINYKYVFFMSLRFVLSSLYLN